MPSIRQPEHRKRPGVCYVVTDDGIELPVIDVTHPAFALELAPAQQHALVEAFLSESQPLEKLPGPVRRLILSIVLRGSVLGAGIKRSRGGFMSGLDTYLLKLGADNLGSYAKPIDRKIAASVPALSARLRVQDLAQLMAAVLAPQLAAAPERPLHCFDIASGPAIDVLNALLLVQRDQPGLLARRRTLIHALDLEAAGPAFGRRALAALQAPGAALHGLDVRLAHVHYDWDSPQTLLPLLAAARAEAAISIASSEGGLFEYGSDAQIIANLRILRSGFLSSGAVVGTVTRAGAFMQRLHTANAAALRPRGLAVFRELVEAAGFRIARSIERPMSDQVLLLAAEAPDSETTERLGE